jgi:hypothetical protein
MFSYVGERDHGHHSGRTIVTIALDRAARRAQTTSIRGSSAEREGVISGSDAEAAHALLARAAHLVEMFDQLGWADDDPRSTTRSLRTRLICAMAAGHRGDCETSPRNHVSAPYRGGR